MADYGRVVFLLNHPNLNGGCSGVGKWLVNFNGSIYVVSEAWIGNISNFNTPFSPAMPFTWTHVDFLLSHEIGHSLGVNHANGWDCGDNTLYGDCQHVEYGNDFDTMGDGLFSLHFNAFYKDILGWFGSSDLLSISQSGRYTINPLETVTGTKAAKIVIPTLSKDFYLEYRRGIGFDSNLNNPEFVSNQSGLFVNMVSRMGNSPAPHLLDMEATNLGWQDDSMSSSLNDNFQDSISSLNISKVSNTPNDKLSILKLARLFVSQIHPQYYLNYLILL